MNVTSIDIKDILLAESALGLVFGSSLHVGKEPTKPDECVTIFDTPGSPPQLTYDKKNYFYPSIQIRVRSNAYLDGWDLINDIKILLHSRAHEVWNGTYYSIIYCSGEPFLLDWDNNNRARFVINFDIQRREE